MMLHGIIQPGIDKRQAYPLRLSHTTHSVTTTPRKELSYSLSPPMPMLSDQRRTKQNSPTFMLSSGEQIAPKIWHNEACAVPPEARTPEGGNK